MNKKTSFSYVWTTLYLRSIGHCNQHTLVNRLKPVTIKVIKPVTTISKDQDSRKGVMQRLWVTCSFFFFLCLLAWNCILFINLCKWSKTKESWFISPKFTVDRSSLRAIPTQSPLNPSSHTSRKKAKRSALAGARLRKHLCAGFTNQGYNPRSARETKLDAIIETNRLLPFYPACYPQMRAIFL